MPSSSTSWLNGIRGFAALIVAFIHFIAGEINTPFRGYWAEPAEENRRLYQLLPFRILFADQAMVALFFIVSAYSISIGPLKLRETAARGKFLTSLASSVFRRPIRLYMPVLVLEAVSHLALWMGLYSWQVLPEENLRTFRDHALHFCGYMLHLMNPFIQFKVALNIQVWTIPAEFKGSCFVFLVILATANLRPTARLVTIQIVALVAAWHLDWHLFTFMSGLIISEVRLMQDMRQSSDDAAGTPTSAWVRSVNGLLLLLGFYLLCIPEQPFPNPWGREYGFIGSFGTSDPEKQEAHAQMWRSSGAIMCMYAISKSASLQAPFNTAVAQYLGKISFGLYLVHVMIYGIFRNSLIHSFWYLLGEDGPIGWIATGLVLAPLVIWMGDLFYRVVDTRSIKLARWLDDQLRADERRRGLEEA